MHDHRIEVRSPRSARFIQSKYPANAFLPFQLSDRSLGIRGVVPRVRRR